MNVGIIFCLVALEDERCFAGSSLTVISDEVEWAFALVGDGVAGSTVLAVAFFHVCVCVCVFEWECVVFCSQLFSLVFVLS